MIEFSKLQKETVDEQKALGLAGFCVGAQKNRAQLLGPGD